MSIIPLRIKPDHKCEMVSQVLFGEYFLISEVFETWIKIKLLHDSYEGWIDAKQFIEIDEEKFIRFQKSEKYLSPALISKISCKEKEFFVPMGSNLPFLIDNQFLINDVTYQIESINVSQVFNSELFIAKAKLFLETPYLWGGKSIFGIDCSGFSQVLMAQFGINLFRDAYQQATQGELVGFSSQAKVGDLAFFENSEGNITHVGVLLDNFQIIHAHGSVRIDVFDNLGIFNKKTGKHSHRLRFIKRFFP